MPTTSAERAAFHRAGQAARVFGRNDAARQNQAFSPQEQLTFRSALPGFTAALTVANTGYWVYLGRTAKSITVNKVIFHVTVAGAGAQTAEVAIATSVDAPNRAAKALTVVGVGAAGDLTATGVNANATNLATVVGANTHLWVGLRTAMATTQPTVYGLTADMSDGAVLSTATPGVLAVGTTYTGALITASVTAWQAPNLLVSLA